MFPFAALLLLLLGGEVRANDGARKTNAAVDRSAGRPGALDHRPERRSCRVVAAGVRDFSGDAGVPGRLFQIDHPLLSPGYPLDRNLYVVARVAT
mgnify:CR=1 FL=1